MISPIPEIIEEIKAGRMVIIVDDEDRENEGDIIVAAEFATPEVINFMITHARGIVCLTLTEERCEQLALPLMVQDNRSVHHTNFTLSIEAAEGVTTGVSAYDRARTIEAAIADDARPTDIVQPGHIFPLMAMPGGVLVRAGHTEAGSDLARLAGLKPASVLCEIINEDGTMARMPNLVSFAQKHGLKIGTVSQLIEYRSKTETLIAPMSVREINTIYGKLHLAVFQEKTAGISHFALVFGDITPEQETLVRVHTPFSFLDCLCIDDDLNRSYTIETAAQKMAGGPGILLILRRPETEADMVARLTGLGYPKTSATDTAWDPKIYGVGAQMLKALGVGRMRLLSAPFKMPSMSGFGLEVTGYEPPQPELSE